MSGRPHVPVVWAIRVGSFVELYDKFPFDAESVRLADFRTTDFEKYFEFRLPEETPTMIRLRAREARYR